MPLTFQEVYGRASSCSDHVQDIDQAVADTALTLVAMASCGCVGYGDYYTEDRCQGGYCDTESFAIGQIPTGQFLSVYESSDTTGHGCQCSGSCAIWPTLDQALKLGINEYQRKSAMKQLGIDNAI